MELYLDDSIYNQINLLCRYGDMFFNNERYDEAVKKYDEALLLLPYPQEQWDAFVWIAVAKGDAFFFDRKYDKALVQYSLAMNADEATTNPYIYMRLGEAYYENNNYLLARKYIQAAYKIDKNVFVDTDTKYLQILKGE